VRRVFAALAAAVLVVAGCGSDEAAPDQSYGAQTATVGESLTVLGWNMSVANLRFDGDYVLADVDAARNADDAAEPEHLRFGLYGALYHPIEATALGACRDAAALGIQPLAAPTPDRLTGTVCLGPMRDQNQVRGIYAYSPQDRMPGTTIAYPAAFPVGLPPVPDTDTGLSLKTSSVAAFTADGAEVAETALGQPDAFTGNGYMLLGLDITGAADRYSADSARRGGPLMVLMGPTLPPPGLSYQCAAYGASVLVLPDSTRDAVALNASLCSQGNMNAALLYASVSVVGTHAALWTSRD
jgi:hypothetical protein